MSKDILHKLNESIIQNAPKQTLPLLKTNPKISKEKQLAVYIDGYRIRLSGAVKTDHPTFCYYLGNRKSDKIITYFVENNNSDFYSLDFYPFKFANYIQDKKLDKAAKELAILEGNIAEIFMKPDSEPLDPNKLITMQEAELDKFRFQPRTASALLDFNCDVEKFLQDFRADKKPKKIEKKKNYIFIVRHNNEVKRHYILNEEYELIKRLFLGLSIDEAVAELNSDLVNEMLPQFLQKWLINGFFKGL